MPDPAFDAKELLKSAFGFDTVSMLLRMEDEINGDDEDPAAGRFKTLIRRRAKREPLQHILGNVWFMGLEFQVTPDTLIPRPDTEILVETVLENEKDAHIKILDLGTGSGCIAVSLKKIGEFESVAASDISPEALTVAKRNARKNEVDIDFILSNLFDNIRGNYDIIVSNPPYIKSSVIETLSPEVRSDPRAALDGGDDGLVFYRSIILEAPETALRPGGRLYLEIGSGETEAVRMLMREAGFVDTAVLKDLAGLDRVVYGRFETGADQTKG